jgi:hypothetical protein
VQVESLLALGGHHVRERYKELLGKVMEFTKFPSQLNTPGMGIHPAVLIKVPEGVFVEFRKGVQRI